MKEQKKWTSKPVIGLNLFLQHWLQTGWVQKAIWFGIRFGGGFLLSRAVIFDVWAPFGLGWQAATGGGAGGLAALLGGLLGYISLGSGIEGLKYIAILILVYAANLIFQNTGMTKHLFFPPLAAGTVAAFVGIVFVAETGFEPAPLLLYVTEILLVVGSGYFYTLALSQNGTGQTRRTISLLVLYVTLLISLSGFTLIGGIAPARLAAGVYVLYTAYRQGAGMGSAAGLTAGCAMDLSLGYPYFSMSYGIAGLLTGVFKNTGKFVSAVVYVLTSAVAALWAGTSAFRLTALLETFAVSVIFMLLPIRRPGGRVDPTEEDVPQETAMHYTVDSSRTREHVRRRLEQSALAFREVYTMLASVFDRYKNDEDTASVFARATDTHCRRCALRALCWDQEMTATRQALSDATGNLSRDGRLTPDDLPGYFTSRCIKLGSFIDTVNREMTALLSRRQYQSRLRESRAHVHSQYSEMSRILSALADELGRDLRFDEEAEARVSHMLSSYRIPVEVTVAEGTDGRGFVELYGQGVGALLDEEREKLVDGISLCVGYPLSMPEQICTDSCEKLIFGEAETLCATIGIASQKKHGQTENGDSGAWFKTSDGRVFLILSDGMGTGYAAGKDSAQAVRLLERFLRAGIDPAIALSMLNSALVFRGEATTDRFVTVDLCICNLMTGHVKFYKSGACPSYVKRGSHVSRVSGQSWPVGLGLTPPPGADLTALRMDAGDLAIMMSDGACETGEEAWIQPLVEAFDGESPRGLAGQIMEEALRRNGQDDDMMVLVLSLNKR